MINNIDLAFAHLKERLRTAREFLGDWQTYSKHAANPDHLFHANHSPVHKETQLTKDYHRVEKGLALARPKRPFGKDVEERLDKLTSRNDEILGEPFQQYAAESLQALRQWNSDGIIDEDFSPLGGSMARRYTYSEIRTFLNSRKSIRDFSDKRVDTKLLLDAAGLSTSTPSVCNRQAARVHFYVERGQVRDMLKLQNGNRGFGEQIPALAVITVDRRLFSGSNERNQRWIDGGLFSMTLVWALHAMGLSTCMLNMSVSNSRADQVRDVGKIPESEDIVVMCAIGYASSTHRIARSPRRSVESVAFVHNSTDQVNHASEYVE